MKSLRILSAWAAISAPLCAIAAPNEIKVFTDEIAAYGEQTLETHVNKASRTGPAADNRVSPLQVMPEYSYGIWRNWEFSLQLPVASQQERLRTNGYRTELQYVAPHNEYEGFYWGMNVELANLDRNGEPRVWNLEFQPILGYRAERWHFAANPGLTRALSGVERRTNFEPAAKAAYRAFGKNYFGLEYYVEAGPIQRLLPNSQRSQVIYFAWDGKIGKSDVNIGIGRGFTDVSDRWVLKTVFEFSF